MKKVKVLTLAVLKDNVPKQKIKPTPKQKCHLAFEVTSSLLKCLSDESVL